MIPIKKAVQSSIKGTKSFLRSLTKSTPKGKLTQDTKTKIAAGAGVPLAVGIGVGAGTFVGAKGISAGIKEMAGGSSEGLKKTGIGLAVIAVVVLIMVFAYSRLSKG